MDTVSSKALNNCGKKKTLRFSLAGLKKWEAARWSTRTRKAGDRTDTPSLLVVFSPIVKGTDFSMLVYSCLAFLRPAVELDETQNQNQVC